MAISDALTEAKASILSLTNIPFQRSWAENLQETEMKREVAGTSRIEGAYFTKRELETCWVRNLKAAIGNRLTTMRTSSSPAGPRRVFEESLANRFSTAFNAADSLLIEPPVSTMLSLFLH